MIRKIFIVALLPTTLFFSGCQNGSQMSSDDMRKNVLTQDKRIGLIQSLGGAAISNKATHLLGMEDGKTLYLKSENVDLSNTKYEKQKVEVMGEIIRTTDGKQVMNVKSLDIIDTNTDISTSQPQWIEYASSNLGITLKYRDDYQIKEAAGRISIIAKAEDADSGVADLTAETTIKAPTEINIELLSEDPEFNLGEAMGIESLDSSALLEAGFTKSKITKLSLDAYKKSLDNGQNLTFYFKNNFSYKISFALGDDLENLVKDQNIFYDILASMDFDNLEGHDGNLDTEIFENHIKEVEVSAADAPKTSEKEMVIQQNIDGYTEFKSDSQKFSVYYPKSYYFGPAEKASSGASRSYDFGSKPLEEQSGEIKLDIISGSIPGGSNLKVGEKEITLVQKGDLNEYYLKVDSKVFKLTGPAAKSAILQQMIGSIDSI